MVNKAVRLMNENPESIRLDKTVRILGELGDVKPIIQICIKKAIALKTKIDIDDYRSINDTDSLNTNQFSTLLSKYSTNDKEAMHKEYKKCLYILLKLLDEIQISIKNHDEFYQTTSPDFLKPVIYDRHNSMSLEQKIHLQNSMIEEILKYDHKFMHDLLFDHLKKQNLLTDIIKLESPYIEGYLSTQIEKDSTNPKWKESLYKHFINTKNYTEAIRILIELVNFDNISLDQIENKNNMVTLDDRKQYFKHLLHSIDMHLAVSTITESEKSQYLKIKDDVEEFKNINNIQAEAYNLLKSTSMNLKQNADNFKSSDLAILEESIDNLNYKLYYLEELYEITRKFRLYEINISIFIELFIRKEPLDQDQILNNYNDYIDILCKSERDQTYPNVLFPLVFNILILSLIKYLEKFLKLGLRQKAIIS